MVVVFFLCAIHYTLFIILFTVRYFLLIVFYRLFVTRYSLLTIHYFVVHAIVFSLIATKSLFIAYFSF